MPRATADKTRYQILCLKAEGKSLSEIARVVGRTRRRVVQVLAEARAEYENRRELLNCA